MHPVARDARPAHPHARHKTNHRTNDDSVGEQTQRMRDRQSETTGVIDIDLEQALRRREEWRRQRARLGRQHLPDGEQRGTRHQPRTRRLEPLKELAEPLASERNRQQQHGHASRRNGELLRVGPVAETDLLVGPERGERSQTEPGYGSQSAALPERESRCARRDGLLRWCRYGRLLLHLRGCARNRESDLHATHDSTSRETWLANRTGSVLFLRMPAERKSAAKSRTSSRRLLPAG